VDLSVWGGRGGGIAVLVGWVWFVWGVWAFVWGGGHVLGLWVCLVEGLLGVRVLRGGSWVGCSRSGWAGGGVGVCCGRAGWLCLLWRGGVGGVRWSGGGSEGGGGVGGGGDVFEVCGDGAAGLLGSGLRGGVVGMGGVLAMGVGGSVGAGLFWLGLVRIVVRLNLVSGGVVRGSVGGCEVLRIDGVG